MMDDAELFGIVALANRLGMLPSEVRIKASHWDLIQLAAFDKVTNKEWRLQEQRNTEIERSKQMTPEEKARALFGDI